MIENSSFSLVMMLVLNGVLGAGTPQPEDPMLLRIAPPQCLVYSSWAAPGQADPASPNATERLFAGERVREFLERARTRILQRAPDDSIRRLAELASSAGGAFFVQDMQLRPNQPPLLQGALVLGLGDQAEAAVAQLRRLISQGDQERVVVSGEGSDQVWKIQTEPESPALYVKVIDGYVVVAMGDSVLEGVQARMRAPAGPDWLADCRARQPVARPSSFSYLNLSLLFARFREAGDAAAEFQGADAFLQATGLDALDRVLVTSGLDDSGSVTRVLVELQQAPRGLLGWLDLPPLQPQSLRRIPRDAPAVLAFQWNALAAYDAVLAMLDASGEAEARAIRENVAQMEQSLGFKLREDLLASLGESGQVFAQPGPAGLVLGWGLSLELKDRAAFVRAHDAVLGFARSLLIHAGEDAPQLSSRQVGGQEVHVLSLEPAGMNLRPAWCVADDRFILAASEETVAAQLEEPKGGPIVEHPDVAAWFAAENRTLALLFADSQQVSRVVAPMMAEMMGAALRDPEIAGTLGDLSWSDDVEPLLRPTVWGLRRTDQGVEWVMRQTLPLGSLISCTPATLALLLPAVQASQEAAQRATAMNHLRQIGLAMHNFHDTYNAFPAGYSADKDGKPLLSWRVHILPFLGHADLYSEFRLDEPWDSPHNKELIARMPDVFLAPGSPRVAGDGRTSYLGVGGKDGVFIRPAKDSHLGARLADILDGTSNTVMCVEASDESAVVWTRPADFAPPAENLKAGLLGLRSGGFLAGFGDGSVRFIAATVDEGVLRALFTKQGGEAVDINR